MGKVLTTDNFQFKWLLGIHGVVSNLSEYSIDPALLNGSSVTLFLENRYKLFIAGKQLSFFSFVTLVTESNTRENAATI